MTLVWDGDFPDPFVLRAEGRYWAYATQSRGLAVQVMTSTDLRTWTHLGDALTSLPPWARPGFTWSPSVLATDGGYVLYYATRLHRADRQALAVAVSDSPAGPFVDRSPVPFVYQGTRGGSIDPDPFVDFDGTPYLYWKSDDELVGGRSALWVRQLRPDGLSFGGRVVRVLRREQPWEKPLIEAPCVVRTGGRYHLLYSAGVYQTDGYAVGHAVSSSPTGPFHRTTTDGGWLAGRGQGGQSVVTDDEGRLHLAYHCWHGPAGHENGGVRALHVDRLDLSGAVPRLLP